MCASVCEREGGREGGRGGRRRGGGERGGGGGGGGEGEGGGERETEREREREREEAEIRGEPGRGGTAASIAAAERTGILVVAIASKCARVTVPTLTVLGGPLPFGTPAAFLSKTDAGGVLVMKVKLRSA